MAYGDFYGNAAIDLSKLDSILTNFYIPRMFEQIKVENPGYEFFKDMSTVVNWGPGNTASFATRKKAKKAVVGGTSGRLPIGGAAEYATHSFDYTIFRVLINFLWDAQMKAGHERYVKNMVDQAMTDAKQEFLRRQNIYLYNGSLGHSGTGSYDIGGSMATKTYGASCIVGFLQTSTNSASDAGATGPIKVKGAWRGGDGFTGSANDVHGGLWLQPGDFIAIADDVSGDKIYFRKVTKVDRSTYSDGYASVTLNADLPTGTGLSLNSPIYLASPDESGTLLTETSGSAIASSANVELSDFNAKLLGLANALFDKSYLGTTKADAGGSDDYWTSVIKHNSGTNRALSFELIDELLLELNQQLFTRANLAIMNPGMWHEFLSLSEANHAFFNQKTLPLGHQPGTNLRYTVAQATMGQGDLKILVDQYCPHNRIITCNTEDMGYATAHSMAEASEDGRFLRSSSTTYDEWHGWLRWGGQFISYSPASVGVVQDITQDLTVL
jgi:hypothetical protein